MPTLRLLGRRWWFASDDLVFPSILEIPYRLLWFTLLCLVPDDQLLKPCGTGLIPARVLVGCMRTLHVTTVVILVVTAQQSARGSMTEIEKRKIVGPLLLCKLFLLLIEVMLNIAGICWIFFDFIDCQLTSFGRVLMQSIILLEWIPLLLTFLAIYIAYDPLGNVEYENLRTVAEKEHYHKKSTQIWVSRMKSIFWCFMDKDMKEAVHEIAALLSILFRFTDIVLCDVIAGSILLRVRQKWETRNRRASDALDSAEDNYTTDLRKIYREAPAWMNVEEAYHYIKLSMSAYYGFIHLYDRLNLINCAGICFLAPHLRCCCCHPNHVEGDDCCLCNYAAVQHLSEIPEKDFLYVSFTNNIFEVPFFVLAERERKRIVVTIRGSDSIVDWLTDLTGSAEKFEAEGLPENSYAHKGMLFSTFNTFVRLEPILDECFVEYSDFDLIITGHSLGAAVSILLGIMLKPTHPNLRVFAFSAPSGLLTREAAAYTESFVMTVGVGDDLVMRISLKSAQSFRDRLNETIYMTKLPKYRILLRGLRYFLFKIPDKDLDSTWKSQDDLELQLVRPPRLTRTISYKVEELYIGGRILHIVRHKPVGSERNTRKNDHRYKMRWASAEEFTELVVMPRMLLDHQLENVIEPIKKILQDCSDESSSCSQELLNEVSDQ